MTAVGYSRGRGRAVSLGAILAREDVRFGYLVGQVTLVWLLMWTFHIESPAFFARLMPLALGGFVVNHLLPAAWRLRFFAALSVVGILVIFGLAAGGWLIGVGLALIALCHLPVRFAARVALVAGAGVLLMLQRMEQVAFPWPAAIWPILGSMFMFRLIVYMYELKHRKGEGSWARTIAYFFLLPNVCFPFFPVVDYATFQRTYYDRPALDIYQDGVRAILRGITQLVLYRAIYLHATISPAEVDTLGELVRYLVANFGLYFRVSGQFHLIIGLLHLFGFRLPETHKFFFLASSFTDLWRRINIYWKDFMQKVVYLPVFFRIKHLGDTQALVIASTTVFVATWFFHSYQWFWILGTWLFSATDVAFWSILGVILVFVSLREVKAGRARVIGKPTWSWRAAAGHGWRSAGIFSTLAVLWGLWAAPTLGDFTRLLRVAPPTLVDVGVLLGTVLAVAAAGMVLYQRMTTTAVAHQRASSRRALALGALPLMALWGAGTPVGRDLVGMAPGNVAFDLRVASLNKQDAAELQRGYYERLQGVNKFNSRLWEVYSLQEREAVDWPMFADVGGLLPRTDALHNEVKPNLDIMFHGARLTTNAWGMRDRDYPKEKPAGTVRVALLGQSYVMGNGVGDHETFEHLLEERLNRERTEGAPRVEWLNFAVPRYSLLQHALLIENGRVSEFDPDLVILVLNEVDLARMSSYLQEELVAGREATDSTIRAIVRASGMTAQSTPAQLRALMGPHEWSLVQAALRRIRDLAEGRGMRVAFAYVPTPVGSRDAAQARRLSEIISSVGAATLDINDIFAVANPLEYAVAEWDRHPNAKGHQLIAQHLYDRLREHPGLLAPADGSSAGREVR